MKYKCNSCGEEYPYQPVMCNDCGITFNNATFSVIKRIKDSWNKAEVIELLNKFSYENCDDAYQNNDKWIENNLK